MTPHPKAHSAQSRRTRASRPSAGSRAFALAAACALAALLTLAAAPIASAAETFAGPGEGAGQVDSPHGVAVNQSTGTVYVAEENNQRVDEFDSAGHFLEAFGYGVRTGAAELQTCTTATGCRKGLQGAAAGELNNPKGIAVDPLNGDLYVGEPSNRRVQKFTPSGQLLFMFGRDVIAYGPGNSANNTQVRFTIEATGGTFKLHWGSPFPGGGEGETAALPFNATAAEVQSALDAIPAIGGAGGSVTVTGGPGDAVGSKPYLVTFEGKLGGDDVPAFGIGSDNVTLTGSPHSISEEKVAIGGGPEICRPASGDVCKSGSEEGSGPGEFNHNSGLPVAVDSSGHVWVGDKNRIEEFSSEGVYLSEVPLPGAGAIESLAVDSVGDFYVRSVGIAGVRKYDSTGNPVNFTSLGTNSLDAAGNPRTLALDGSGHLFVGDSTVPYRLLEYSAATGAQAKVFGAGEVISGKGANAGPLGNAFAFGNTAEHLYVVSSESESLSAAQIFTVPPPGPLIAPGSEAATA
ncbi:MAG TPA: hypothetical protein VNY83_02175, partial [Solirubrobacterales bacterium]|nr:hypothetical protein [Solirubrobacterales bacterium]